MSEVLAHTQHTHRCCKRAHLLGVACCWGEKSAGKATKEEEEAQEQRLWWWWWWCGKRVCAASAAPVCVCATTQHQGTQRGQRKERKGKGGAALAKHAAGHWWSRVLSASPWPLRASLLSVCVCEWLSSVLLCVVTRRCFVQRSACFVHRALCLSLSFSARWCVCVGSRCALSLSGTKARGGSDAWRLWCVCRWQALCAAVPPIAVCQGCFCVLLLLVVLVVVFWWWAMEPLGVCVAMLAWLAFVCVVCCVLATQHVVQTWHCVCGRCSACC